MSEETLEERIAIIAEDSRGIDRLRYNQANSRQELHMVLNKVEELIRKMKKDDFICIEEIK